MIKRYIRVIMVCIYMLLAILFIGEYNPGVIGIIFSIFITILVCCLRLQHLASKQSGIDAHEEEYRIYTDQLIKVYISPIILKVGIGLLLLNVLIIPIPIPIPREEILHRALNVEEVRSLAFISWIEKVLIFGWVSLISGFAINHFVNRYVVLKSNRN